MIHSFTPSGVEHKKAFKYMENWGIVIHSFTPSGVEHVTMVGKLSGKFS